jgi:hypothetical protein
MPRCGTKTIKRKNSVTVTTDCIPLYGSS